MGNMINTNKNDELLNKIDTLQNQIKSLNNKIEELEQKPKIDNKKKLQSIDEFVDNWYNENKDVDIGIINLPLVGDVDMLPDKIEKHIYKKSLLIMSTLLEDMLQNISFTILDKEIKIDLSKKSNE